MKKIEVGKLWLGDRFKAHDSLWTNLGRGEDSTCVVARKHSEESIALKERGHGYFGDQILTFGIKEKVEFIPPDASPRPSAHT